MCPVPPGLDGAAVPPASPRPCPESSSPETLLTHKSECSQSTYNRHRVSEQYCSETLPPLRGVGFLTYAAVTCQSLDTARGPESGDRFPVAAGANGGHPVAAAGSRGLPLTRLPVRSRPPAAGGNERRRRSL